MKHNHGKKIINITENYFYFVFGLWFLEKIIVGTTAEKILWVEINVWDTIISWSVLVLLLIKIFFLQRYTVKQFIMITVISFFFLLSVILSNDRRLLSAWLFIVAGKDVDIERVVKIARNILFVALFSIFFCTYLKILDNYIIYRLNTPRYSLGFDHPNQLGLRIFQFIICIIYLHKDRVGFPDITLIIAGAVFCFLVPNSQAAYVSLLILLIVLGIYIYIKKYSVNLSLHFMSGLITGAVAANAMSVFLSIIDVKKNNLLSLLDRALSYRFSMCHIDYILYGVSWFGNRIYISEEDRRLAGITQRLWMDNSYMSLLLQYGILTYLIFSVIYIVTMYKQKKNNNMMLVMVLFLFAVYGIIEKSFFAMTHNIFILSFASLIYWKESDSESI